MSAHQTCTIIIDGTWGRKDESRWIGPESPFVISALDNGVKLVDLSNPFDWSTLTDGTPMSGKKHNIWSSWGMALTWYAHMVAPNEPVNLLAHSHGGQVAAYALEYGLKVNSLVTVATPVRQDMLRHWDKGRENVNKWTHIHTGYGDWWQIFGEIGDGHFGIQRKMPAPAENIKVDGEDHTSLLRTTLWHKRGWWNLLKD